MGSETMKCLSRQVTGALGAASVAAFLLVFAGTSAAAPTITEFSAGITPGITLIDIT